MFTSTELNALFALLEPIENSSIDDQTWKDIELERYCEVLTEDTSLLGKQAVYRQMRVGTSDAQIDEITGRYRELLRDTALVTRLICKLEPLRKVEFDISSLAFKTLPLDAAEWDKPLMIFQWAMLAATAAALLLPFASWWATLPFGLLMSASIIAQTFWMVRVEWFEMQLAALCVVLRVACDIAVMGEKCNIASIRSFRADHRELGIFMRQIGRSAFETAAPGAKLYADWFFLRNVQHYWKARRLIRHHQTMLARYYLRVANIEADLAITRHLRNRDKICWPERAEAKHIDLEGAIHPLMQDCMPLKFRSHGRSAFISGQNASGKSTLLRTLGINLCVSRAFGFCYAANALLPSCAVYTSMQVADSMMKGESLYVAELVRARQLVDKSGKNAAAVYLIDEIFRGTNHLESVSVAAAVLYSLADRGLVLVASHHLILASLLRNRFNPLLVINDLGEVQISPGVLEQTNGIALLQSSGFPDQINTDAATVFGWLNAYLAHPNACPDLLNREN